MLLIFISVYSLFFGRFVLLISGVNFDNFVKDFIVVILNNNRMRNFFKNYVYIWI